MKSSAILATALAMPLMAGTPAPVVTVPEVAPVVTAPAPTSCGCAMEVAGVYRFASRDLYSVGKSIDTYGVDVTAVHALTPNHALTLRVGYSYGSEVFRDSFLTETVGVDNNQIVPVTTEAPYSLRCQIETLSLMPGYRYTHPVSDKLSVFAGVNAGIAWSELTARYQDGDGQVKDTDHDWAFVASAEVGANYKVTDNVSVFAAYELFHNSAKFSVFGEPHNTTHQQVYHGIRAGVQFKF